MKFETLLSRADDEALEQLLGNAPIELIKLLDSGISTPARLRELIASLHSYERLLLSKEYRSILLDFLPEQQARMLIQSLRLSPNNDIYNSLRNLNVRRGSEQERNLFEFFELTVPPTDVYEEIPASRLGTCTYPLFKHQRAAAYQVQKYLNQPPHRVVLHMPTGAGKTRTAMNIIAEHLRQYEPTIVIWLAHSQELCEQAASEFEKAWLLLGNRDLNIYRYWGNNDLNAESIKDGLVVAGLSKTYQAATRDIRFITELGRKCSLVIIDEAHSAVAETYKLILDTLVIQKSSTGLLGLTATPGRTWLDIDADEELARFFNFKKVTLEVQGYDSPIDYLVNEDYLADANFRSLLYEGGEALSDTDLAALERQLDIPTKILEKLARDEQRNLRIIMEISSLVHRHKRIIIFASTVEHSDMLAAVLRIQGIDAVSITSHSSNTERSLSIQRYKEITDTPRILCNYGVLTTGFDAPQTSAAIIARPTKSLVLYSQMVGRAIRGVKAGGNESAEIVTIVDHQLPGFRNVAEAFNHWEDIWE